MNKHIPDDIVEAIIISKQILIQAWREYFNLTQAEMAERFSISQSAYYQMERAKKSRKTNFAENS